MTKIGDRIPVNLNEFVVAEAVVVDIEDGKATLEIPATRIVMGTKTTLTDLEVEAPSTERAIIGTTEAQPPKAQDDKSDTPNEQSTTPTVTPQPLSQVPLPNDAVGEGLAGYQLKEMD